MSSPGNNTSATGGPMTPSEPPVVLEGAALLDLIQETLVALSCLDTTLVRPRYQTDPANIPQAGTAWMAFGVMRRPSDVNPAILHDPFADGGNGDDTLKRQEELHVLMSFYDNGADGAAYSLAALTRDGLDISQNMWALEQQKIYLGYTGELTQVPTLLKTLWVYRVDLLVVFRRQVDRVYRTQNILISDIDLHWDGDAQGDQLVHIHVPPNKPLP